MANATSTTKTSKVSKPSSKLSRGRKRAGSGSFDIRENGTYPLIPPSVIEIIERTEDNLFYNPRSLESFDEARMLSLRSRIQIDGLQQPPIVRFITDGKGKVVAVQLIAGERRLRNILKLAEDNLPIYDNTIPVPKTYNKGEVVLYRRRFGIVDSAKRDGSAITVALFEEDDLEAETIETCAADLLPTMPASNFFTHIPVKAYTDISDERCIGIAFAENKDSQPLTICEEIDLVERLTRRGYKQLEIAEIVLGKKHKSNVTWVSQTANFREQLPDQAFQLLLEGNLSRHGAVQFLSYAPDDRAKLLEATLKAKEQSNKNKASELQEAREVLEDEAELHEARAEEADDEKTADRLRKKADAARKKASATGEREQRHEGEAGKIKQSDIHKGAAAAGLKPRKAKMLSKKEIEELYLAKLAEMAEQGAECPITKRQCPGEQLAIMYRTVRAIMTGERDPLAVIRGYMIELGEWQMPDEELDGPEEADLAASDTLADELGLTDEDYEEEDFEDDYEFDDEEEPEGEDDFDAAEYSRYASDMD